MKASPSLLLAITTQISEHEAKSCTGCCSLIIVVD
ncbi:hypothetical protein V6Z11_D02G213800 [Gossypium hirsutum]